MAWKASMKRFTFFWKGTSARGRRVRAQCGMKQAGSHTPSTQASYTDPLDQRRVKGAGRRFRVVPGGSHNGPEGGWHPPSGTAWSWMRPHWERRRGRQRFLSRWTCWRQTRQPGSSRWWRESNEEVAMSESRAVVMKHVETIPSDVSLSALKPRPASRPAPAARLGSLVD